MSASPSELPRGSSVGRYVLFDSLGTGAMGRVYAGYDPELDRKIALKMLRPDIAGPGEEFQIRLLREAQALARIEHPNVVTIHDVGEARLLKKEWCGRSE